MSDSLQPHKLQHARPPCPSSSRRVYSNSCPLSRWCHPTISSSVIPFSSCLQSFPASESFSVSQFFTSGGQRIGVSASASVLPMTMQDWFPLGWTAAAAAAKSLQLCLILCDPMDGSPRGSPSPGFSRQEQWSGLPFLSPINAWKWKVKVKSLSHVRLLVTPWTAAHQAPPSMGFSRKEYWSGVPLPLVGSIYLALAKAQYPLFLSSHFSTLYCPLLKIAYKPPSLTTSWFFTSFLWSYHAYKNINIK